MGLLMISFERRSEVGGTNRFVQKKFTETHRFALDRFFKDGRLVAQNGGEFLRQFLSPVSSVRLRDRDRDAADEGAALNLESRRSTLLSPPSYFYCKLC